MRKFLLTISVLASWPAIAQNIPADRFTPVCDSLSALLLGRSTVENELVLERVRCRRNVLDFHFNESLGDYPWREEDCKWFRAKLKELLPEPYGGYRIGNIYSRRDNLNTLIMPEKGDSGKPAPSEFRARRPDGIPLVSCSGAMHYPQGLDGRHIALWQSHGRYYEQSLERWEWQRPCLFQTVEDMMSADFILSYIVPMLENAGAYVMMPRERDTNPVEIVVDNDHSTFSAGPVPKTSRSLGSYSDTGAWKTSGNGFADLSETICGYGNPFKAGTSRSCRTVQGLKSKAYSKASWTPEIPRDGEYAVYVSYESTPNSTSAAVYTVTHAGGTATFHVNQKMGGGTWVYLGTFPFSKGTSGCVTLDNATPKGHRHAAGATVSADAVKFGGGMGNIARRNEDRAGTAYEVSGLPRYAEAARYWLQWAGMDTTVFCQSGRTDDYKDDYMSRGAWVDCLSGGSAQNPVAPGKRIPVDLAFAFHSDAGVTPNDSIIGTLAIYTHYTEGKKHYPSGGQRLAGREYADIIQSQVTDDLRRTFNPEWNRRTIRDRSYLESRTPPVPAMLLETFSHQNFADMRYALDPSFRFTVARAVYKGILKFLSNRYGTDYTVAPLPVRSFSVRFAGNGQAELCWEATSDTLERTAFPKGYILYTRTDGGAFDNGRMLAGNAAGKTVTTVPIEPGHIYSFKIEAYNDGGRSFPSEILSIGLPELPDSTGTDTGTGIRYEDGNPVTSNDYPSPDTGHLPVLVVNNFTRVSAPAWFDTPAYAGFDNRLDSGVPYIRDISYIGEMHQFRREMPWTDDDNPGFGASYQDYAGKAVAGNTFDYPYIHGRAIMEAGYPFFSASSEAFGTDPSLSSGAGIIDIICGKQVTTLIGGPEGRTRYTVFTPAIQKAVREAAAAGKDIIVTGAHIGTDIWDKVFPVQKDSLATAEAMDFAQDILGYRWRANYAGRHGMVKPVHSRTGSLRTLNLCGKTDTVSFRTKQNSEIYAVESPDGIEPAGTSSHTIMRYCDTGISAGICHDAGTFRTVCLGFPLETVSDRETLNAIFENIFKYFEQ